MDKSELSNWKVPWKGIVFAFLCSIAALVIVFSKIARPSEVLRELENFSLSYFFGALFFVLSAWIIDGQRLSILAKTVGQDIPWWQWAFLLGAANFLTLVTPFAGGGGALVIYFLYRQGVGVAKATALVTAGGIAGQISLSALAFIMFSSMNVPLGLHKYIQILRFGALGYILILIAVLIIITHNERWLNWFFSKRGAESRGAAWLEEFQATYRELLGPNLGKYLACLGIALVYYVIYYMGGFVLLTGFGAYDQAWYRFGISVLFGIAPVFSPIPGGAGASELIAFLVLENILSPESLGTFIVLWRTVVFYLPIILGGSTFTFLVFRWAATPQLRKEVANDVILPDETDHNR